MVLAATDCQLAGRYQLCKRLAAGGMGQVWQAVDQILDRPVAVKLPHDDTRDHRFVSRLRAEARRAAAVSHPGIAGVFDYGETTADGAGSTGYLVMELVDGEPLSALLAREGRRCLICTGMGRRAGRRPGYWRYGGRSGMGWPGR
jgi:serine/threonine protein kinase